MNEILVSVIMPAYNAEKYIEKAISSVDRQQGDFGIELLIIEDAGTDNTERIIQGYECSRIEIVYVRNERNLGVAESRNIGIRSARGNYIAFLDADDWWSEDKLVRQLAVMEGSEAALCATARELMNPDGSSTGKIVPIPANITYEMLLRTNSIPCSSVLMKTKIAREFYMCHDELHEDYILWLRVLKKYGQVPGINEPMLKSRLSEGGKSRNKWKSASMHFGVYRYLRIGFVKSIYYFIHYIWHGLRKYN